MNLRRLVQDREDFGDRAPITEALIDIQVSPAQPTPLDALRTFDVPLPGQYPTVRTQTEWEGRIHVEPESAPTVTSRHAVRGFVFDGGRHVVQLRRDGFSFSRLDPYDGWASLRAAALTAWNRYREIEPATAVRVTVRYINKLHLPARDLQLPEWFALYPATPPALGQMSELLLRVALHHPDDASIVAMVTLAALPPEDMATSAFLLDVEARTELPPERSNDPWAVVDALREYKNDIFFGSLTPKTREYLRR